MLVLKQICSVEICSAQFDMSCMYDTSHIPNHRDTEDVEFAGKGYVYKQAKNRIVSSHTICGVEGIFEIRIKARIEQFPREPFSQSTSSAYYDTTTDLLFFDAGYRALPKQRHVKDLVRSKHGNSTCSSIDGMRSFVEFSKHVVLRYGSCKYFYV